MMLKKKIKKAQAGDVAAFKAIFDELSSRLFAYALSRTKSRDDALDIVQDSFIDLWRTLPAFEYKHDEAFYGFVFIILKRKIYRFRQTRRDTVSIDDVEIRDEPDFKEDWRYLKKNIDILSPQYQTLLHLRYWKELPFKEIAQTLNIKEGTAKVWHHRALQKLKGNVHIKKYDI